MNVATKAPPRDRQLDKLFRSELVRIARQYQAAGRELLAGNPDPQQETYYVVRSQTKMTKADFEHGGCRTWQEAELAMRDMWDRQGFSELSDLAPQMAKLADKLKESQLDTEDVSPFIYVMY